MAEPKTKKNEGNVEAFLHKVENKQRRDDSFAVLDLMRETLGEEPKMWGTSIVGFGSYTYKYATGRTGDWMLTGFSPRKQALTLYIMAGFDGYPELMGRLGKYKTGKSCLYIKKLSDVDPDVLKELVKKSADHVAASNAHNRSVSR